MEELEGTEFVWGAVKSYKWLVWRIAVELPATFAVAWYQLSALKPDFPSLSTRRWIGLSFATTILMLALELTVVDGLRWQGGGWIPYVIAYEGLITMLAAWVMWRLVLQDHAFGGTLWVSLYGAAGLLSAIVDTLARHYPGMPEPVLGITAITIPFLVTPIVGIAVARLRRRPTSLARVFA